MALFISSIYLLCVAAALGQQDGCVWDSSAEVKQGLDPASWDAGATKVAHLAEVREDERCQAECCGRDDCQLALIGTPADGLPECFLVNCLKEGKDVCSFVPSTQFRSYRKISRSQEEPQPDTRSFNSSDDCRTQKVVGNCRAAFPRFYYDVTNQTCKPFTYGGCGGNNNNFYTLQECETACSGVTGDLIVVPPNIQKRRMAGSGKTEVKVVDIQDDIKRYQEGCTVPANAGMCRAAFPMFFFEASTQSCKRFIYGGCGGNKNRYTTEEECMSQCAGKDGGYDEHGNKGRDRWTPAFFLVATLAVISVILLVGLLLISSRRTRQLLTVTLDDKQELLPEEYPPAVETPKQ